MTAGGLGVQMGCEGARRGVGSLIALMMLVVWKVLTTIEERGAPQERQPPGNLDTRVISAPATFDSSKAPTLHFLAALPFNASSLS